MIVGDWEPEDWQYAIGNLEKPFSSGEELVVVNTPKIFILAYFKFLMAYLIYRSSKNITRNSNWRGYHWCPQPINLDMFSRRKPITKIPMVAKTANSAGKKRFHFISNGWGVINQFYMR